MNIQSNTSFFASSIGRICKSAATLSLLGLTSRGALGLGDGGGSGGGDPTGGHYHYHYQHGSSTSDVVCRMTVQHTLFEDGGDLHDSDGFSTSWGEGEDRLACVSIVNGKEDDEFVLDDYLSEELYNQHGAAIAEDDMYVSITSVTVHDVTNTLAGNEDTVVKVLSDPPLGQDQQRRLERMSLRNYTLAILRVTTLDSEVVFSAEELEARVLADGGNAVSPINQFRDMSFGQFQLEPKGVFDVFVNRNISDFASAHKMLGVIHKAVKEQFGVDHPRKLADKVNICVPPGSQRPFLAYTSRGSWRAMYSDHWCASLGANIHEMAHQIGLSHSHVVKPDGKDFSCYMSRGGSSPVKPIQAFNGPKHKTLGWFDNRTLAIDPLVDEEGTVVELATFVDFDKTTEDQPVLLVIDGTYVLQYNRAKGFNIGTRELADMVTITADNGNAGSERKAALNLNDESLYTMTNYLGSGRDLMIKVCDKITGDNQSPDSMVISVGLDEAVCPKPSSAPSSLPTATPSLRPTTTPSMVPSASPSHSPSLSPSSMPSAIPSTPPSCLPSSAPSAAPSSSPSFRPSHDPSSSPSFAPSSSPSSSPTSMPSALPSLSPSKTPSFSPSNSPSAVPSSSPSALPTSMPSALPSLSPSKTPSFSPSHRPSSEPSSVPSTIPTDMPTSSAPTSSPSSSAPTTSPTNLRVVETVFKEAEATSGAAAGASVPEKIFSFSLVFMLGLLFA